MQTRVSTKGQVVLPGSLRRRLGIQAGDPLKVELEGERIILTALHDRRSNAKVVDDPLTGLPIIFLDMENPPILTSREVEEMLADFP